MKLTDRLTPETDRNTWDADLGNMVVYADIAKSLEQRLAHAVEALKSARKALFAAHIAILETAPCAAEECKQIQTEDYEFADRACRTEVINIEQTLSEIEEAK